MRTVRWALCSNTRKDDSSWDKMVQWREEKCSLVIFLIYFDNGEDNFFFWIGYGN